MAKTAIVNKATGEVVGVTTGSAELNKMVLAGANLTEDQVDLVTAKNFQPSDKYPTFKEMAMTQAERDEAAAKAKEKAAADEQKEKAKAEREAAKAAKSAEKANKPAGTRNTSPLEGEYHIVKAFPATAADHPKMPIWEAIANNSTVEAAKAACPAENPKRATNGVYTFNSEFRYFLKTGYVVMGARPEQAEQAAA